MAVYSIATVKTRYFELEKPGGKNTLHLEPPKVKTLAELMKVDDTDVDALSGIVSKIISKNKEGYKMDTDAVQSTMTLDQMVDFLEAFLVWLNSERAADPN